MNRVTHGPTASCFVACRLVPCPSLTSELSIMIRIHPFFHAAVVRATCNPPHHDVLPCRLPLTFTTAIIPAHALKRNAFETRAAEPRHNVSWARPATPSPNGTSVIPMPVPFSTVIDVLHARHFTAVRCRHSRLFQTSHITLHPFIPMSVLHFDRPTAQELSRPCQQAACDIGRAGRSKTNSLPFLLHFAR